MDQLKTPSPMKDMEPAASRIARAIGDRERILVFGDYDADGVTATTVLLDFLRAAGANTTYYIPHRTREGYSLQADHIDTVAIPGSAALIITVDCGTTSHAAVTAANQAGMDVIVTDHHNVSGDLPPALAIVNPKRPDCTAGLESLSGVGVAFFLSIALRRELRDKGFWQDRSEPNLKRSCDLVALGTIADIVPLTGVNRFLAQMGLEEINRGNRPGLRALVHASGIANRRVDADDIAFRLAPRLNAAGRMDHADIAVRLLTEAHPSTAAGMARDLNRFNGQRQDAENELLAQTLSHIQGTPGVMRRHSLVLCGERWHQGILGIVAARLVRRYHRPVILISTADGKGKGSGRSIPGFDLYLGLTACAEVLERFGGHRSAAGLALEAAHIDRFRDAFDEAVEKMTSPDDFVPRMAVDYELDLADVSDGFIDELESLKPFGSGNPEPVFISKNVSISSPRIVGKGHRKMRIQSSQHRGGRAFDAIQFNIDSGEQVSARQDQVLFRLGWNYWNANKTAQLTIEDM